MWSQPTSAGQAYMFSPGSRGGAVHKLEAMFSWALGKGLVIPRVDCRGQGTTSSSGCLGLQEALGWFHPGFLSHGCPLDFFFWLLPRGGCV